MKIVKPNGEIVECTVEEYKQLNSNNVIIADEVKTSSIILPKTKLKSIITKPVKYNRNSWTEEEDYVLKNNHNMKIIQSALKNRTYEAIKTRIRILRAKGFKIEIGRKKRRTRFPFKTKEQLKKSSIAMTEVNKIVAELRKLNPTQNILKLRSAAFKIYKERKGK